MYKLFTYQEQCNLVSQGLAAVSVDGKFSTFKYARKVMYDYLWDEHPDMKFCRGQTYDNTNGNLVTLPPAKSFNYLENGTWNDKPLGTPVVLYKKFNGFMAAMSMYDGELVVSTTGSTKSDFAKLARKLLIAKYGLTKLSNWGNNATWLFEVCDKSDPHIVKEKLGVHYLGCTYHNDSEFGYKAGQFEPMGKAIYTTIGEALKSTTTDKGEGWMMWDFSTGEMCKLKTDYYVGKKKLMRMSAKNVELMYNDYSKIESQLPYFWQEAPEYITRKITKGAWLSSTDQQRRIILEDLKG